MDGWILEWMDGHKMIRNIFFLSQDILDVSMAIQSIQSDASEIYKAAQSRMSPEIIPQFSREDMPTLSNIFNSLFNFNI